MAAHRPHPALSPRTIAASQTPYWLFALFTLNAPTLYFTGHWRYAEIVLLALLIVNFQRALSHIGKLEGRFVLLFVLTAAMQLFSDLFNDVVGLETVKRVGTYLMLAALIIIIQWISRNDPKRMALMIGGYCLSWVLLLYIGSDINEYYAIFPWRLGLGAAATLFLCLLFALIPRLYPVAGPVLIALAGVHVFMNARSLAVITAVVGVLTLIAVWRNHRLPSKFRPDTVAFVVGLGIIAAVIGISGLKWAVENKMLPDEMQAKTERQMSHPYGLLAAGRPETVTAIYAISKRPLLGYGSTAYDNDVQGFYAEMIALKYLGEGRYAEMLKRQLETKQHFATPSHSHIFGAWADAGILAVISWVAFLGLAVYVLVRAMFWCNPWSPLFMYVALTTIWAMVFSPGPIRVDIALKFMVMVFAVRQFGTLEGPRRL